MTSPEKWGPESVDKPEEAWEAAHAEKPFRDVMAERGGELNEEQKKTLEWVASSEGEKAIKEYRDAKGAEKKELWSY